MRLDPSLILTLQDRHGISLPHSKTLDYEFGKKFIDLFAFDPDSNEQTGLKRVKTIIDYMYYDKFKDHLARKLDLTLDDAEFMISTLAQYKFFGAFPRENEKDEDPEKTAFEEQERKASGE